MRRRVAFLSAAVLLISMSTGCAGKAPERQAELCTPKHRGEPCASARVGVEYPVALFTHCGVGYVYFAGRYWVIDPPQPEGANELHGFVTLVAANKLVQFRGDDDRRYAFKPAPTSFSPAPCS